MTLIIQKLDGTQYDLKDLDIRVKDFYPDAPEVVNEVVQLDNGQQIIIDSTYGPRSLTAECRFVGRNLGDYYSLMREVFLLFNGLTDFYIINPYEGGLRWRVRTNGKYSPSRTLFSGDFSINFICPMGVAESIATTQDLKEWDIDKWAWGIGINWDEDLIYTFTSNNFIVNNFGTVIIDPRKYDLEIIIKANASSYLQIANHTTGDTYRYNGALSSGDTLIIKGIRSLRNGVSVLKNTNKKLISLAPGDNNLSVTGGTIFSVAFNFRGLYL